MYLDPPNHTAKAAMYYDRLDYERFFDWLGGQRARYALSLNGFGGEDDQCMDVPEWHYDEHVQIDVGKSPYHRSDEEGEAQFVNDSLYIRREW